MYDLIIIGLGPAGINACIYAKRSNLNILVFEKNMPGGTLHTIKHVDNYLGYDNVDGTELAMLFYKQFKDLKVPMKNEEVIKVELNGNEKIVKTNNGTYKAKAVIIATGRGKQKLGLDNENIKYNNIDGIRIDYEDGFTLIRQSNTGPVLTVRFERKDEESLEKEKQKYLDLIKKISLEIN